MNIAFVAWTPLHVINIINVQQNFYPNDKADLFIYDEFRGAKDIYLNIKKLSIFENIYFVRNDKKTSKLGKIGDALFNNYKKYLDENLQCCVYDEFFIQGDNYFSKLLYAATKKVNKNLSLNYVEDGMGIYINPLVLDKNTKAHKYYSFINRKSIYKDEIQNYYVYEPKLVDQKINSVKRIPKINDENPCLSIIKTIFGVEQEFEVDRRIDTIYIEQPFAHENFNINQKDLLGEIEKNVKPSSQVVVKLHPRTPSQEYSEGYEILKTNLPWEIFLLENKIDSIKILTVISTAAFTPYLMFGRNVESIFLSDYLLTRSNELGLNHKTVDVLKKSSELVKRFNQISSASIKTPKTKKELAMLLK